MGMTGYCNDFPGIYVETLGDRPFFQMGGVGDAGRQKLGYEFVSQVTIHLNTLRSQPLGKRLITEVSKRCMEKSLKVVILYSPSTNAGPYLKADEGALKELIDGGEPVIRNGDEAFKKVVRGGPGAHGIVFFDPDGKVGGDGQQRPVYIAMAHEMIHCHHYLHASCARVIKMSERMTHLMSNLDCGLAEEEARTIGLGPYKGEELSENSFRTAFGLPERTVYTPTITLGTVKRTA